MRHALLWITADIWKVIKPGLACWQYLRVPINLLFDSKHHPCIAGLVKHHQGSRLVLLPSLCISYVCGHKAVTGESTWLVRVDSCYWCKELWRSLIKPRVLKELINLSILLNIKWGTPHHKEFFVFQSQMNITIIFSKKIYISIE